MTENPAFQPSDSDASPPILPRPPLRPSIGAALALTGIFLGVFVMLQVTFTIIHMVARQPPPGAWAMAGQMLVAFAVTCLLVPVIAKLKWSDFVAMLGVYPPLLASAGILTVGAWAIAVEIGVVTERMFPVPEFVAQAFEQLFGDPSTLGTLVLLVLVPPIAEEFLCRGLVLRAMLNRWRPPAAILVSALIFGTIHLNPWQFFYAVWLGLVLGWVFWRTRSLGLCMLMHAGNNLLSWFALRWDVEWIGMDRADLTTPPPYAPLWMLLAGVGLVAVGIAWTVRMTAKQPSTQPLGVGL